MRKENKKSRYTRKSVGETLYLLKSCALLAPFIIGVIGFYVAGEELPQAVYASLCLYGMGQKEMPPNLAVEIARWIAPLSTLSILIIIFKSLRYYMHGIIARLGGRSVAVYGPESEKEPVLQALGRRGIDMKDRPVRAHSYILLDSEEENLAFYRAHLADKSARVFVKCRALPTFGGNGNLHPFRPEQTATRLFWQEHSPYAISKEKGHRIEIVIIGLDTLGRELLVSALQYNIFSADQVITYRIYGDNGGFMNIYHELDKITDSVVFSEKEWHEELDLIERADMVILAEQQDQIETLTELTLALPAKKVHVLSAQPEAVKLMASEPKQHNIVAFHWQEIAMDPQNILCESTLRYAKRINMRYNGVFSADENAEELAWEKLDTFTRLSNIRAADFKHVAERILEGGELTDETLDKLAELEHIRWCRYHFLNNWKQGDPEGGESKNKNVTTRIHRLLVDYKELDESYKDIDRNNVKILLDLDREA